MRVDDVAAGRYCSPRHLRGCHSTRETKKQNVLDDRGMQYLPGHTRHVSVPQIFPVRPVDFGFTLVTVQKESGKPFSAQTLRATFSPSPKLGSCFASSNTATGRGARRRAGRAERASVGGRGGSGWTPRSQEREVISWQGSARQATNHTCAHRSMS